MTLSRLLTPEEVAKLLGTSAQMLAVWRCTQRINLPYVKVGRSVRYREDAVEQFIRDNEVNPASGA